MTSHRRRRSDTMPQSSKEKAHGNDSSCSKEKSEHQECQKTMLPLFKKSVYIDIKNGKQAEVIEGQLRNLGATIEKFLSREINYVISSSAQPKRLEEKSSNDDNPASPSCSVPSPFSSVPSPTPPSEVKAPVISRARKMSQIACSRNKASTVVANAEKWGVKVVAVETASKWLDREMLKVGKEAEKSTAKQEVTKKEVKKAKKKVVKRKKKTLKGCYIKFESADEMYRPVKLELDKWPRVNVLAPPGLNPYCEVKMKMHNFLRRHSSMRNTRGSLSFSSGRASLKKARSFSSVKESASLVTTTPQATADVVAVPITTTGDVKRHLGLVNRRRPDRLQGYCECCRVKYKDINVHVKEDSHQSFARDKSNFESLDALIKQVPSTSQFLQDILLRHCVQKQSETVSHSISNEFRAVAAKSETDLLPVISPIPSEATPHAAEGHVPPPAKSCPKSPNVPKAPGEMDVADTEDTRPHAVVIRRRYPSGAFVSPRRREPTPSKKPWMQERIMVFRDSPMASLQPSGLGSAMKDTSLPNLSHNVNDTLPVICDRLKNRSIVRSLIDMPDFITSSVNGSETERLSVNNTEEEMPVSVTPRQVENITETVSERKENNLIDTVDSKGSELGRDFSETLPVLEPVSALDQTVHTVEAVNVVQDDPTYFIMPRELFVPCIADRVKRRSRAIEQTTPEDDDTTTTSHTINDMEEPSIDNNIEDSAGESLMDVEENVERLSDICEDSGRKEIGNEFTPETGRRRSLCSPESQISQTKCNPSDAEESNSLDVGVSKELPSSSHRRKLRKRNRNESHQASRNRGVDEYVVDLMRNHSNRRSAKITPKNKTPLSAGVINKRNSRSGKRGKGRLSLDRPTQELSENFADKIRSRVRQCKLFVHEGFYADDKVEVELDTMSSCESKKPARSEIKVKQEIEQETVLNCKRSKTDDCGIKDEPVEMSANSETNIKEEIEKQALSNHRSSCSINKVVTNNQFVKVSAKGDSNFELKVKRMTESGKRIIKGKTIEADWDMKQEDNDIFDESESGQPVVLSVGERVKNRRSCTLFNHVGQYANDWEDGDRDDDRDCKTEHSSVSQSPQHKDCKTEHSSVSQSPRHDSQESLTPAVVLRRYNPSSRSGLTKSDKTWCKLMSKTDWTQFEDDAESHQDKEDKELSEISAKLKPSSTGQTNEFLASPPSLRKTTCKSHPTHHLASSEGRQRRLSSHGTIESNLVDFKSPVKREGVVELESQGCLSGNKGKLSLVRKTAEKPHQNRHLNHTLNDTTSLRSPRLKLKIRRDVENDCYSSTLEELHDENVSSPSQNFSVDKKSMGPQYVRSNEMSPKNGQCSSDSIDLLETPRRARKYNDCSVSVTPLKNCRLSHSPSSPMCKRNVFSVESRPSKMVRKNRKRKFSDAERESEQDLVNTKQPVSDENDQLHQKELRNQCHQTEDGDIRKPTKKWKRNVSLGCVSETRMHAIHKVSKDIALKSPMKRNKMKNSLLNGSVCNESSAMSENILHFVPEKIKSLKSRSSETEVTVETLHSYKNIDTDNEFKHSQQRSSSKSKKDRRKRKGRASDDISGLELKKAKLDHKSVKAEEKIAFPVSPLCHSPEKVVKNMLVKTRSTTVDRVLEESGDKLFTEPSFGHGSDVLNFVPNFSSPGKTNSSWDDACDSYLNSSKSKEQIPGHQSSSVHHAGNSVAWSPFKLNSPVKSCTPDKKSLESKKGEFSKNDHCSFNSSSAVFSNPNPRLGFVTPTKRSNSLRNAASPSVEKVDSVISFNHMSPQRLHFSPMKLKSPIRNSERSPGRQKSDSGGTFNHMSPQRLTFSPSKQLGARLK